MKSIHVVLLTAFIFISCQLVFSQDTLTVGQVYDFDVGDEFHYETSFTQILGFQLRRVYIDDKSVSDNGDTIFYSGRENHFSSFQQAGNSGMWQDFTRSYTNLDSVLGWSSACKNIDPCILEFEFDTFCDIPIMRINRRSGLIGFEENSRTLGYGAGLGQILDADQVDDGNVNITQRLIYYKKLSGECGSPNYTSSLYRLLPAQVYVYPNPCNTEVFISSADLNGTETKVQVTDLNGKIMLSLDKFMIKH